LNCLDAFGFSCMETMRVNMCTSGMSWWDEIGKSLSHGW